MATKKNDEVEHTPLKKYKQEGKKLAPPLARLNITPSSWINDRLPEMLWAILIVEDFEREEGLRIFRSTLKTIEGRTDLTGITHSDIAKYPIEFRKRFIEHLLSQDVKLKEVLRPLLLFEKLPAFKEWQAAIGPEPNGEEDGSRLAWSVAEVLFHQTQKATDCRWVKLMGLIMVGKMKFMSNQTDMLDEYLEYPNKGDQRKVRPMVRSAEMAFIEKNDLTKWPSDFWDICYEVTMCIPEINKESMEMLTAMQKEISADKKHFNAQAPDIRDALISRFFSSSKTTQIDSKHESVFGIALYAIDTFIENIILLGSNTITGRVTTRIILESYITLAYLVKKETEGELLWDSYRDYGSGQASLIKRKYEEEGLKSSIVDLKKLDMIANEDKWSEFVLINLGQWDETDLRKVSIAIGEKQLYDKYYAYTSGYVHANWAAVRESSMQKCLNPLHRNHRIPSYGLMILPNVNEDCRVLMNKILKLVNLTCGELPNQFNKRPLKPKTSPKI